LIQIKANAALEIILIQLHNIHNLDNLGFLPRVHLLSHHPPFRYGRNGTEFHQMVDLDAPGLTVLPDAYPLTRLIAQSFDAYDQAKAQHSAAV